MSRSEIIARSAEKRLDLILIEMGIRPTTDDDPLAKFADPGPPRDVALPGYKRHNFAAKRLKGG